MSHVRRILSLFRNNPAAGISILALAFAPLVIKDPYIIHILIMLCFSAYVGAAWNILGGYAGQFSLCHAAFFGVSSYMSTLLFTHCGLSPWGGMLLGATASMLLGLFVGFICFRYGVRGIYFVLITMCFNEIIRLIIVNWKLTGGPSGILIPLQGNSFSRFQFTERLPYFYIIFVLLLLMIFITARLEKSKTGDYLIAIREDEDASEALGVRSMRYKLVAMAISCFAIGLGGTFYAQYMSYIAPDIVLSIGFSIEIIFGPIIGGVGTVWGPLIGASILTVFSEVSRVTMGEVRGLHFMLYGIFIIIIMLYMPNGVLSSWSRHFAKRRRKEEVN